MKKFMFIAALACFALTANAQTKEELKAQKEAQKAAEKIAKKAQTTYDEGMPNAQYGRKETNYQKIEEAKGLIDQALENQYTKDDRQTLKTATEIYYQLYNRIEKQAQAGDTTVASQQLATAEKLINLATKYDSIYNADPKKKDAEYKTDHTRYQIVAFNPLVPCINAAQNLSGEENDADAKKAYSLSSLVLNSLTESSLFKDFENPNKKQLIEYSKAFRAQALSHISDAKASDVEDAYAQLKGTQFEAISYNALCNYFRDKDQTKYIEYLKKGMANSTDETYPSYAFMLMQYQFNNKQYDDCLKTIEEVKVKCPNNDNTINAYLMQGQILFEQKKYTEAENVFKEAVEKYPDNDQAITMPAKSAWMKAQASGNKADMQHAIDMFKQLQAKYPSNSEYWGEPLYILYNNTQQLKLRDQYKKYYTPVK